MEELCKTEHNTSSTEKNPVKPSTLLDVRGIKPMVQTHRKPDLIYFAAHRTTCSI